MSIRSLVQIAQSQKKKTNKQTYPVQTSQLSVICKFLPLFLHMAGKLTFLGHSASVKNKRNKQSQ